MKIISDLDGTLLSPSGAVPRQLGTVVSSVTGLGITLAVATSRPLDDVYRIFGAYGLSLLAILNDGAETITIQPDGKHTLCDELAIKPDDVSGILATTTGLDILPFVFMTYSAGSPNTVICPPFLSEARELLCALTPGRPYLNCDSMTAYVSAVRRNRNKIRAIAYFVPDRLSDQLRNFIGTALPSFGDIKVLDYSDTRCSGYHWLELAPSSIGKQQAVERLLRRRLIERPLVGLGNGKNDVDFLRVCDLSICPRDSDPAVLAVVDEVAPVAGGAAFCDWLVSNLKRIYVRFQS